MGYYQLTIDKVDEAIEIFKLNCEFYPESADAYDLLGEAYMKKG